jgi:hypothetical protein
MADIPEEDLEETRAALAPTLEATAAILPWVSKPRAARFDAALNQRWIEASQRLSAAWTNRHLAGLDDIRPAIFALYGIALETADTTCLRLGEALAGAADRIEEETPPPRLIAALTASIECLGEADGLEHEAFAIRAEHFAARLEATLAGPATGNERSPVLDHLFASDARERLELMRDALAALPPDAYALRHEANQIAQQAELLELYGIMHLARQLSGTVSGEADLDNEAARQRLMESLKLLAEAIALVDI